MYFQTIKRNISKKNLILPAAVDNRVSVEVAQRRALISLRDRVPGSEVPCPHTCCPNCSHIPLLCNSDLRN